MTTGFGRMLRKEDQRFVRGQGTYVDDVHLRGMLHGAVLRSPHPHARILSVDTVAAEAHPKVKAVITGETLNERDLAWMPTLAGDTQAVLATDKVRFQGQEVAFVVAEDHYSARDALELIDVEYEPLPAVADARRALDDGAPLVRDDHPGRTGNHIFDWESGDAERTDRVFRDAEVTVSQDMLYPRVHPAPLETCGIVADFNRVSGKLTVWATSQAPHAHRTLYAMVAGLPEHKIRVISPDIGGGFGNKVPIYPGYLCAIVGSGHGARRPRRVQRRRAADQVPGRVLRRVHGLLRPGGGALPGDRGVHQQGAGRGGLLLLVPHHRGGLPGRADGRRARLRARPGPGRTAHAQPAPPRAVPVHLPDRLGLRLR